MLLNSNWTISLTSVKNSSSPMHTVNKHFTEHLLLARQHRITDQRWGTESHGLTGQRCRNRGEGRVLCFRVGMNVFGALTQQGSAPAGAREQRPDEKRRADRGVMGREQMGGCVKPWSLRSRLAEDLWNRVSTRFQAKDKAQTETSISCNQKDPLKTGNEWQDVKRLRRI